MLKGFQLKILFSFCCFWAFLGNCLVCGSRAARKRCPLLCASSCGCLGGNVAQATLGIAFLERNAAQHLCSIFTNRIKGETVVFSHYVQKKYCSGRLRIQLLLQNLRDELFTKCEKLWKESMSCKTFMTLSLHLPYFVVV